MAWAQPEYATAQIAVWWDMKGCPIPEGYDARRIRPNMEAAFRKLGYSGPVSITAYGDQTQTPCHLLRGLSSIGVSIAHTKPESTCSLMYSDMLEWRAQNPPPATMLLISDKVQDVFDWDLARLQQRTKYNFFVATPSRLISCLALCASEWLWGRILEPKVALVQDMSSESSELSAMFYCKSCKSCSFNGRSLTDLDPETRTWGKNYAATPEYATAQIAVWWDMIDCPIPKGYDARQVRPSLEAAFKKLGYSGPVSITAYGNLQQAPDHLLRGLSSTGVALAHAIPEVIYMRMNDDFRKWHMHNPPPATTMFISDSVDEYFNNGLVHQLQQKKYNLFLAYSYRPHKMSVLVTSAEWLWESLLAGACLPTNV
ncbi:unnamed protein product [Thlaspi arvense]|uniref:NYN domain-containing protein n=1 Tax=Thlaspi arvense TaxID=13288 RepID=A0AAU9S6X9_THLAR|nr:unnamed protein product [Thlaspi arvense]